MLRSRASAIVNRNVPSLSEPLSYPAVLRQAPQASVGDQIGTAPGFRASGEAQYWIPALRRQVSIWPGPLPTSRGRAVPVLVTGLGVRHHSSGARNKGARPRGDSGTRRLFKDIRRASACQRRAKARRDRTLPPPKRRRSKPRRRRSRSSRTRWGLPAPRDPTPAA